jgi:hypothetical protein
MKPAVIGAGSTYTPELVDKAVRPRLALDRFGESWPAGVVHDHTDAEIWTDEEAMP